MEQKPKHFPEGPPDQSLAQPDLVAHSLARWEQKRQEALMFDFATLGYTTDQLAANARFRREYEELARTSSGDPDAALALLEARGVKVIRNSKLLAGQKFINLFDAKSDKFSAMFATPAGLEKLIEKHKKSSAGLQTELESARGAKGVIFLDKAPRAKSVFHEAAHAVQQLEGLEMEAADPVKRLHRELEANTALIRAHEAGLLPTISKGAHKELKSPLGGITARVDPNDVYEEALYFAENKERLTQELHRVQTTDDTESVQKIRDSLADRDS